ncbi:hypothetical protein N7451_005262 [Penicillium sp. IBT 35674x]|nr:hypothetical protein N7451_005262 [Penicillium sp. IBT 35674x]
MFDQCLDPPWSKKNSNTILTCILCNLNDVPTAEHPHEMQLSVAMGLLRGPLRGNAFGVETTGPGTRPALTIAALQFQDCSLYCSFEYAAGKMNMHPYGLLHDTPRDGTDKGQSTTQPLVAMKGSLVQFRGYSQYCSLEHTTTMIGWVPAYVLSPKFDNDQQKLTPDVAAQGYKPRRV